ncbi:zinc finger protein ZFPM1 isoform X2 [Balaenoptera acutorostrata]|uniref:Zinc finger protein ZFPM1 isoform X2 n=1 Tax=Balaenoptera acutorostrata TaxID=9767 RepID=A0ABM3SKK5_BALAC|nr:zinc finger protein ZFPM1 isoform X2 [Balaenoptera acutorostrata]
MFTFGGCGCAPGPWDAAERAPAFRQPPEAPPRRRQRCAALTHAWSRGEGRGRAARGQRPGSLRDMEAREEAQAADTSLPEQEATALEPQPPSSSSPDATPPPPPLPPPPTSPGGSEETEDPEPETRLEKEEASSPWSGPDELELLLQDGQRCVRARCSLAEGLSWGPFRGSIQTRTSSPGQAEPSPALTLLLEDEACWLRTLPRALTEAEANSEIYRKDGALWCRLTRPVAAGGRLSVLLAAEPHSAPRQPAKEEPAEPEGLAASPAADIQLLPQQAGMASILATAVVNKDVFPCKDCGIWYRSERNLQAHLLYYCASRQGTSSPAVAAPDEKPKETYPNERVCPFPQCRKSCPSASSLEIHMRSHSGERPFVCLICLSAFTTKANCERHLKVHTDTLTGVCHSCGFISTTRDILYSHLVTNHMVCQPGSKVEIYSPGAGHPTAKLPADSLAGFQQHTALHGPLASADLGLVPAPSPGLERKALAEATNGETGAGPQNGGGGEPPATPRSIKVEAAEEPEAEPGPPALSRTPSPPSAGPSPVRVKAELSSPTPGSSPGPGALFLPQLPAAPPASEILAKMSELVHSRLQAGAGVAAPAGLFTGAPKGATCFDCDITFNNVNNFYVHKRLYCSGRRPPDDTPPTRRPKAAPAPPRAPPAPPPAEADEPRSPPGPGAREDEAGGAATPEAEAEAGGRGSEGSPSPGSGADEDDDPRRTLCEACNIRFSRHETYTVHKRYYCASRHDPPPRRPPPAGTSGTPAPAAPPVRTRRRRKLYELHVAGPTPPPVGPAQPVAPGHAPTPPASPAPRPGSGNGGGSGPDLAEGPIDLSKKPRRQAPAAAPGPAPGLPALADYHECTACRVSFHSLEAYLAHKKFSCPSAPRRLRAAPEDPPAVVCPYCPPNGVVRGDLIEHFRLAHGLLLGKPPASSGPGAEARTPSPAAPRDGLNGQDPWEPPAGSPRPGPPPATSPEAVPAPPSHSDKGVQTPSQGTPASMPNGNHRYCRLCNIRFSSLSTFIAHKKYYCSSHAAEHVK